MNRPAFRLDRRERKLLGVCAGLGRSLNIDPTFVRVAFVAVPLLTFVTFWQALVAYVLCGLVGAFAAGKLGEPPERVRTDGRARAGPASRTCARSSTPTTAG